MKRQKGPSIQIVEVGLRDGLQNEKLVLSVADRVHLATQMIAVGLNRLELGAFVRADRVPSMQGSKEVILQMQELVKTGKINAQAEFSALVPNAKGMLDAIEVGLKEVAIFGAASETFSKKNINCSIVESFERFQEVLLLAKQNKIKVRGYLSTCFGCPYEGRVDEKKVVQLAVKLHKMGCFEISIGDTIGVADPKQVKRVFKKLLNYIPAKHLAGHFHDTRGTALANILAAFELGIKTFDTSVGGLGGCPYAPGASGNVSTEDVVYMFERMGESTGVNLSALIAVNAELSKIMQRELASKVSKAGIPKF